MAFNTQNFFSTSYQCGEDLSQCQFQFVNLGSNAQLYGGDKTSLALGILSDVPSIGPLGQFSGTVVTNGTTRICVGGVYPVGTYLVPYTDGVTKGIGYSPADAGAALDFIRARTLQASTAAGDIVACELMYNPFGDVAGMTGAQGITGVRGITGAMAITGIQGLQGITGALGLQGITGLDGVQGITGTQGPQGITGLQGLVGATISVTGSTGLADPTFWITAIVDSTSLSIPAYLSF
jgi:hypothetical protein